MNAIKDMVDWKLLGTQLGVMAPKMQEIDVNNGGRIAGCRWDLMQFWLESDVSCSWKKLIDALRKIDKSVMAEKISANYCPHYKGTLGCIDICITHYM